MDNRARTIVLMATLSVAVIAVASAIIMQAPADQNDGTVNQITGNIAVSEAQSMIESRSGDPNFVILDVRTPEEFREGHIENSVNMDFYSDTFEDEISKLDREKTYLVYCASGRRSGITMENMKKAGFNEVYNMEGGIGRYTGEGHKIVR